MRARRSVLWSAVPARRPFDARGGRKYAVEKIRISCLSDYGARWSRFLGFPADLLRSICLGHFTKEEKKERMRVTLRLRRAQRHDAIIRPRLFLCSVRVPGARL